MNVLAVLEASRSLFDLIDSPMLRELDRACEGVIVVDHQARIRWVSQRFRQCLNLGVSGYFNGRPVEEILPDSLLRQVTRDARPVRLDLCQQNGEWLVESRMPLRDRAGKLIGAMGIIHSRQPEAIGHFAAKCRQLFELPMPTGTCPAGRRARYRFADFVGTSVSLTAALDRARHAARLDTTVLLVGETGSGKDMLAQAIHNASIRRDRPFVAINLPAMPEATLEAELFGEAGKIEAVEGGTLFLDEIGDLPMALQCKLSRLLQAREYESETGPARFRIIASSSVSLAERVRTGHFRPELFYRLSVLPIDVPPLRQRPEDLADLCDAFLRQISLAIGIARKRLSDSALQRLARHAWPGNVRELRNMLEQASIFSPAEMLEVDDFNELAALPARVVAFAGESVPPLNDTLAQAEQQAIEQALRVSSNNRTLAARKLGISRANLYEKMRRLGLSL
ncbi:sigma-54 interaction domain-containing protein [Marinobacter sp. JSM 1782161]|uniref:sigma-54 interaction domain-containing protein n=1 Tax=Marinobacter sp. JSM 1782161 TaxID=2685906 RepID=UPI001402BC4A|nr:sigma 54-interacting transcriptional regulator [Marinobacter sp. JSM 1782161]